MKILVACEESQRVTIELRKQGHEAYSCDIQECSGNYPQWHIQGDAIKEAYSGKYDMIIGFPPCTYLSRAGAVRLFPNKVLNEERYQKGLEAKDFFMKLYNAPCKYVALENPTPLKIFGLPKPTQAIQPHEHGHPYTKRTCLWLRNLPPIQPTKKVNAIGSWVKLNRNKKTRSKTFEGIAKAMSIQWSSWVKLDTQSEGVKKMIINTANLHTIERHIRDDVSKHGYTKVFEYLDQLKNIWVNGTVTLSFDHRSVLFKKNKVELIEHGFKGYEYIINTVNNQELPILSSWYQSQQ